MAGNQMHIISPLIGLIVNALTQVIGFRLSPKFSLLKSIILGFLMGFIFVFLSELVRLFNDGRTTWQAIGVFLTNLLTYTALGYCYFHFINLGETARRVRILREIYDSNNGLSIDEILARYNAKIILQYRIDRLIRKRQAILNSGKFKIDNPTVLYMAKIIKLFKLIFVKKKTSMIKQNF